MRGATGAGNVTQDCRLLNLALPGADSNTQAVLQPTRTLWAEAEAGTSAVSSSTPGWPNS